MAGKGWRSFYALHRGSMNCCMIPSSDISWKIPCSSLRTEAANGNQEIQLAQAIHFLPGTWNYRPMGHLRDGAASR
jgi:hypothetical protein